MIFFSFHRIKFGTSDDPVIIKTTANNNMLESKKQDTKWTKRILDQILIDCGFR
jgi:hypothetical protein